MRLFIIAEPLFFFFSLCRSSYYIAGINRNMKRGTITGNDMQVCPEDGANIEKGTPLTMSPIEVKFLTQAHHNGFFVTKHNAKKGHIHILLGF